MWLDLANKYKKKARGWKPQHEQGPIEKKKTATGKKPDPHPRFINGKSLGTRLGMGGGEPKGLKNREGTGVETKNQKHQEKCIFV